MTFDLSEENLTDEQIRNLSGVRLNEDGTRNNLGGSYNHETKVFSFTTLKLSRYTVSIVADVVRIGLTVGDTVYSLNGENMNMDTAPVIVGERTLVPIRLIAESLGAQVDWHEPTRTVIINMEGKTLSFAIGEKAEGMDVPAQIMNGRTMVPLAFVTEYFDSNVSYDDATRTINIAR